jgi:WD40 repeat protein
VGSDGEDSGHHARQETITLKDHGGVVESVPFSPDGKMLTTASMDKTVKVWDAASGHEMLALKGHSKAVSSAAFSPDGKRLAWQATMGP